MNHEDDDLRALYAGLAMMGILAGRQSADTQEVVRAAVQVADALIKELQRPRDAG